MKSVDINITSQRIVVSHDNLFRPVIGKVFSKISLYCRTRIKQIYSLHLLCEFSKQRTITIFDSKNLRWASSFYRFEGFKNFEVSISCSSLRWETDCWFERHRFTTPSGYALFLHNEKKERWGHFYAPHSKSEVQFHIDINVLPLKKMVTAFFYYVAGVLISETSHEIE